MRKHIWATALATGLAGTPISAGQPIEESLVECAVPVEFLLGEHSFIPGQNDMTDLYGGAAASLQ